MASMFNGASAFNQPIGKWNVTKVGSMAAMFMYAIAFNQEDLSAWDVPPSTVRNVRSMARMFFGAKAFQQPLCWVVDTGDTVDIFTGTGTGTKPAAGWGKLSARSNCEYDWAYLARRRAIQVTKCHGLSMQKRGCGFVMVSPVCLLLAAGRGK